MKARMLAVLKREYRTSGQSTTAHSRIAGGRRYAPRRTQDVYSQLISAARQHLGLGQSVVLDASWIDASNRALAPGARHRVIR